MNDMTKRPLLTLILAAGLGTRMKSALPKVLHSIGGRAMLGHVVALAGEVGASRYGIVAGPEFENFQDHSGLHLGLPEEARVHIQKDRLGTAHAVLMAEDSWKGFDGDVLVLYGDTPLITAETLLKLREGLADGADIAVLGFHARNPQGYGRLLVRDGQLEAIREQKDASGEELEITFCNSGVFAFRADVMASILPRIGNDNASGEYYLTDAVEIGRADGLNVIAIEGSEDEVLGVNSRNQLAQAEHIFQERKRQEAMAAGVTLLDPGSVYFSYDTRLGQDVLIEPHVFFGPGVRVDDGCHIRAFSHFEQAHIGENGTIGPFARLRPGARLGKGVRVGNYVEIKNADVETGAKVNHLTYVGDARVGEGANIGAGTITCNYDGFNKHHTDIGAGAFIGSNSALVAPVKIGEGAYIGSGSVITRDVRADALGLSRSPQQELPDWARRYRDKHQKKKS